jgi:hypothetical protein
MLVDVGRNCTYGGHTTGRQTEMALRRDRQIVPANLNTRSSESSTGFMQRYYNVSC